MTPEEVTEAMEEVVAPIKMMLGAFNNDPHLIPLIAQLIKKLHDEFINVGFTQEQATQMVCTLGRLNK